MATRKFSWQAMNHDEADAWERFLTLVEYETATNEKHGCTIPYEPSEQLKVLNSSILVLTGDEPKFDKYVEIESIFDFTPRPA